MGFISNVKESTISKLFPRKCPLCGAILLPYERICGSCGDDIEFIRPPVCKTCGRPAFECSCVPGQYHFDRCVSPFVYTKAIRRGMHRFKFDGKAEAADFFAKFMAAAVRREYSGIYIDAVTCVPMHVTEKRKRGYNQAELLARSVAKRLELPLYTGILDKPVHNSAQHSLTKAERQGNISGVFEIVQPYRVRGKTILLCDDIITTGCTLDEISRILMDTGARQVICVTAAAVVASKEQSLKRIYV